MLKIFATILLLSVTAIAQTKTASSAAEITLERWGCLGTCPVYKIVISSDGSVVYEGKANVHAKGVRKSKISQGEFARLVKTFNDANFFAMSGGAIVTDAPVRIVSLTLNGHSKELEEGCSCVPDLVRLENEVDKTAGSEKWVRGRIRMLFHWPWIRL